MENYQTSGPTSTPSDQPCTEDELSEQNLEALRQLCRQRSWSKYRPGRTYADIEEVVASAPCVDGATSSPPPVGAGDSLADPADYVPAEQPDSGPVEFSRTGFASGLVIKSINGENHPLPRNPKEWSRRDRVDYLDQDPLAKLGKKHIKTTVTLLHNDVKIRHRIVNTERDPSGSAAKRGHITILSRKSKAKMVETARNVTGLVAMLTLTYPAEFPCDGRIVKKHLELIRKWLLYRGVGAFWFLEFQERGAPHFHLFTNGTVDKAELSQAWYKIVGSQDEKHLRAGTCVEAIRKPHAIATYAAKYAAKADQKLVPAGYESVGRFWGNFGGVKVKPIDQESGTPQETAPLVRVIRNLENSKRRQLGIPRRKFKGKGIVGFTSYNTSQAIRRYLISQVPF